MEIENVSITIDEGGDWCGSCGCLIEYCKDDCPVLLLLKKQLKKFQKE
jgi:hypothetical protein